MKTLSKFAEMSKIVCQLIFTKEEMKVDSGYIYEKTNELWMTTHKIALKKTDTSAVLSQLKRQEIIEKTGFKGRQHVYEVLDVKKIESVASGEAVLQQMNKSAIKRLLKLKNNTILRKKDVKPTSVPKPKTEPAKIIKKAETLAEPKPIDQQDVSALDIGMGILEVIATLNQSIDKYKNSLVKSEQLAKGFESKYQDTVRVIEGLQKQIKQTKAEKEQLSNQNNRLNTIIKDKNILIERLQKEASSTRSVPTYKLKDLKDLKQIK